MILQALIAFIACYFFSIVQYAPKKQLIFCGLSGSLSWFIYVLINKYLNNAVMATFCSAILVTALSRIFSHIRKEPSTLFLMPGIIPLVPGAGMYYTMYAILNGNMLKSYAEAVNTIKLAGVIAIGIIIVLSLPYSFFNFIKSNTKET